MLSFSKLINTFTIRRCKLNILDENYFFKHKGERFLNVYYHSIILTKFYFIKPSICSCIYSVYVFFSSYKPVRFFGSDFTVKKNKLNMIILFVFFCWKSKQRKYTIFCFIFYNGFRVIRQTVARRGPI